MTKLYLIKVKIIINGRVYTYIYTYTYIYMYICFVDSAYSCYFSSNASRSSVTHMYAEGHLFLPNVQLSPSFFHFFIL